MKTAQLAFALAVALAAPALGEEPRKEDFAYGIEMRPRTDAPILRVPLPLDVYRKLTRRDLGDLRVFNARSELVPHEIWRQAPESRSESTVLELDVYPLPEATPAALAAVRVRIERGAESASLQVTGDRTAPPPGVAAYVLDGGPREDGAWQERLLLEWPATEASFVERIQVETSDDLERWSRVGEGVVAELGRGGARLLRSDVPLEGRARRYLRIAAANGDFPVTIERARLELTATVEHVALAWQTVSTTPRDAPGELGFELPGPLLVEAVEILPETNSWTTVSLFSRDEPQDAWRLRASAPVYDLAVAGERIASTRLTTDGSRDRLWRILPEASGGGFGARVPEIRVGVRPDELVFVARGEAPFTLAYGSARVDTPSPAAASLRELATDGPRPIAPGDDVLLSEPRALAGEVALEPTTARDWKRILLWGALGLASIVLLLTARAALSSSADRRHP